LRRHERVESREHAGDGQGHGETEPFTTSQLVIAVAYDKGSVFWSAALRSALAAPINGDVLGESW